MEIKRVLSLGSCLGDLLLQESEEYLRSLGREKGGMTLVGVDRIEEALKKSGRAPLSAPGGSACNTAVGLARLGTESHFLGRRGRDELGAEVERALTAWGVRAALRTSPTPTGRVLSVITPDAQRTMMTYLGAAAELAPEDLKSEDFAGHDLIHLEGYMLFNRPLTLRALELASAAGARVSLDLSSFEVVRQNRSLLREVIDEYVDLIIANEDEASAFTGDEDPEENLEILAELAEMAVVKLGAEGVLVAKGRKRVRAPGYKARAVDTTGAGDLWASGFIHGLARGFPLDRAARLGNRMGAAVVEVLGAAIPDEAYVRIRAQV